MHSAGIEGAAQLRLALAPPRPYAPEAFLWAACNAQARTWLDRVDAWPQRRLALWGPASSGKTHLLHVWATGHGGSVLHGSEIVGLLPPRIVAVDAADTVRDARALLHLMNACAEAGCAMLLAGRTSPTRWPAALPDLASRLRALSAVHLDLPDDAMRRTLLRQCLAERYLLVPAWLQDWLLLRLPRTADAVQQAATRLNEAAWAGRRVTRQVLLPIIAELEDDKSGRDADPGAQTGKPS